MNDNWRDREYDPKTVGHHAQKFGLMLEQRGLLVGSEWHGNKLAWSDILQAFSDAADDFIDEHVRMHREKTEYMNAHASTSESLKDSSETPNRISAQSMIIRFMNGAEEIIHIHHPMIEQYGWTFRELNGVPYLVLGHGTTRRQYPLSNIRFIELSPDLL